jgi:lipopolysaccharide export LptBFGC system permease protein LptF
VQILPDKEAKEDEKDRTTFLDRLLEIVLRQAIGAAAKTAERVVKRALRLVAMVFAGIVIAVLGVTFLSVGAVKGLAFLMPSWLAWIIVGIVLFLIGLVLAFAGSKR